MCQLWALHVFIKRQFFLHLLVHQSQTRLDNTTQYNTKTRMCANAQRDGRPAEHRWRPLFNAAVWLMPITRCHAVTSPRCKTRWNLQGCLKLPDQSQPSVGRSSPYCGDMWRTYCCLTSFFPIVDTCLSCEDIARKVVRWCPDGDFWRRFCVLHFQRAACSRFQTCILNSH